MQTTTTTIEVELDLSGTFYSGEQDVGLGEGYEDLSVDGLYALTAIKGTRPQQWRRFDLLTGLDDNAREIVLANIQGHIGDDVIIEALDSERGDPADDRVDDLRDAAIDRDLMEGVR